jgi:hypothetical protein
MSLTLQDIDNAEHAVKRVRVELQAIGRELHKMRTGRELGPEYGFDSYSRQNYCGSNYVGQEGPDWGEGTPIFSLCYYWSRAEDTAYVTIPLGWLEQDWRALEQARLDEERRTETERKRVAAAQAARDREAADRAEFERLKAKFEEPRP